MPSPAEQINKVLRRELCVLRDKLIRVNDEVVIRRVEKSIALRVSKLLCDHPDIKVQANGRNPTNNAAIRRYHCDVCKSSVSTL